MLSDGLLFDDEFWRALESVDVLKSEMPFEIFLEEAQLTEQMFKKVHSFLKDFEYELCLSEKQGRTYISPPKHKPDLRMDMSLMEWIAFQAEFAPKTQLGSRMLTKMNEKYKDLNLFKFLENQRREGSFGEQLNEVTKKKVALVDEALLKKHSLVVSFRDGKKKEIFPYQLSYVEGALSLIGEDCQDRCLVAYDLNEVARLLTVSRKGYKTCFSRVEINDFMAALREMSGKEMRLILKFSSAEKFDLSPKHQFLGSPYITSNSEGDLIWSATVEVSDELMDWLYSIRWAIMEIMDPENFRSEFLNYCKEREKKVA